jgi:YVTN family beta-propeller protein
MTIGPLPPSIIPDAAFNSVAINGILLTEPNIISGIPLSVSTSGIAGFTPVVSRVFTSGVNPTGIAFIPNSTKAYVANNNNYAISGSDSVTILDVSTGLSTGTINDASFNGPYTITTSGTKAYVTNSTSTTITVIDTTTDTVSGVITGFDGPSGMVIKNGTGYVNNYGSSGGMGSGNAHSIFTVNLSSNTVTGTIDLGSNIAPAAMALTIDQRYVYVACYKSGAAYSGTIKIVDTLSNTLLSNTITGLSGPFSIVMNPNGLKAYITNFGPYGTTVSILDLSNNTITKTINVGIQPSGAAVTSDGAYLYISNYNTLYTQSYNEPVNSPGTGTVTISSLVPGQGTINVIDLVNEVVVPTTIQVGQSPSNLAISPDGKWLVCSNYTSNTVSGICINL